MTAETTGEFKLISRYKDVDIVDILQCNEKNSFFIKNDEQLMKALPHFEDETTVWLHQLIAKNSKNKITFQIVGSLAFKKDGTNLDKIIWPCDNSQDVCKPCEENTNA